eukprot:gene686-biopygen478
MQPMNPDLDLPLWLLLSLALRFWLVAHAWVLLFQGNHGGGIASLVQRLAGCLAFGAGAAGEPVDAGADQRLDLAGRIGAALGEVAHLASHHRKAAALLAGAGRLDRGVQRQDVGLEGDAVDHADED